MSDGITTEYRDKGQDAVTATFTHTASDLFWVSYGMMHRRPSIWIYYAIMLAAMLYLLPAIISGLLNPDAWVSSTIPLGTVFVLGAGFLFGFIPLRIWRRCEAILKMPSARGTQEYFVDDEGVIATNAVIRTEMKWGAFVKVVETKAAFLFYVSPGNALLLPKRALPDAGDQNELRCLLRAGLGNKAQLQRSQSDYPQ